jgi:DNA processing protein
VGTLYKLKKEEATYWIALAHLQRWGYLKINNLIIKFFHEYKISIEEFFPLELDYDKDAATLRYKRSTILSSLRFAKRGQEKIYL